MRNFNLLTLLKKENKDANTNFFSESFLLETLKEVGFEDVEVFNPPADGSNSIHLNAKLSDKNGNALRISVYHSKNWLKFEAYPDSEDSFKNPKSYNKLEMTKHFFDKYIETPPSHTRYFGNKATTDLLKKCKEMANNLFDDVESEFKRHHHYKF